MRGTVSQPGRLRRVRGYRRRYGRPVLRCVKCLGAASTSLLISLSVGQEAEVRVLRAELDKATHLARHEAAFSLHPWEAAADKYKTGERVRGKVTRLMDFGAFVERG